MSLLQIVTESTWISRKTIAQALGKKRLNPYNITMLDLLIEKGHIEIQQEANRTPIGFQLLYRRISNIEKPQ
jgi:hypothetical protein